MSTELEIIQNLEKGFQGFSETISKKVDEFSQWKVSIDEELKKGIVRPSLMVADDKALLFAKWFIDQVIHPKAGMTGSTGPEGGYLVPEELLPEIIRLIEKYGTLRRIARIIPMRSDTIQVPAAGAGAVTVSWKEIGGIVESSATNLLARRTLEAKTAIGVMSVDNNLFADATVDVGRYLMDLFAEAIAGAEDEQGFAGSGSPFTGIANHGDVNEQDSGSAALTYVHVIATWSSIDEAAMTDEAVWIMRLATLAKVIGVVDSNGRPIFQLDPTGKAIGTILGHRIELNKKVPANSLQFGNFRYFLFGSRQKMEVQKSEHVSFTSNETVIRVIERISEVIGIGSAFARRINIG